VLVGAGGGHLLAAVPLQPADGGTDLTRPGSVIRPGSAPAPIEGPGIQLLTENDLSTWTALGLALACADLVGTMRGAVDVSVEYASTRCQFGRPIGSFQAVQHLLADAYVFMEGSRSAARYAAWAVDALEPGAALAAAAAAKAYCARAARTVCETSIQVHGGTGNTWECLAHVHLRRALLSTELLGGVGVNLDRVLLHHGIGGGHGLR
jgi:alkylation response protein AidB-like acyl-CoA dehydrogenase